MLLIKKDTVYHICDALWRIVEFARKPGHFFPEVMEHAVVKRQIYLFPACLRVQALPEGQLAIRYQPESSVVGVWKQA